jgi:hypothetical protein
MLATDPPCSPLKAGEPMQTPTRGWWCEEHQRLECVSPRKHGRGQCHGSLVGDSDRCRMHLGKKARPVIAEAKLNAQAAVEMAKLDVPPVVNPFLELSRLAGQCVAWKDTMATKVNELTSLRYESAHGLEQLRSELALWERSLDRSLAVLTAMSRLGIEERLTGIRQKTADMLERALDLALEASGCGLDGTARARETFRQNIRVVGAQEKPKALPPGG